MVIGVNEKHEKGPDAIPFLFKNHNDGQAFEERVFDFDVLYAAECAFETNSPEVAYKNLCSHLTTTHGEDTVHTPPK